MKTLALVSSLLTTLSVAALFALELPGNAKMLVIFPLVMGIVTTILVALSGSPKAENTPAPLPNPAPAPAPAPAVVPPPAPMANTAEAEIIAFFGLLQEKGRLLDFLMDDITPYEDAQVGAAARVVHQGCREVLREHFQIGPVSTAEEGSKVTVPTGPESADYRLVGKIAGEPPFSGTLVHKGWKTESLNLPRVVPSSGNRLPALTPAEVELS
jgi:hypothetical protein